MYKTLILLTLLAGTLGTTAQAGKISTTLNGQFNSEQENACIHVSLFFFLTDCTYAANRAEMAGNELPWTGPTVNPIYYELGSAGAKPTYEPEVGDGRISPTLSGSLAIDDGGTPDPLDDLISGELVVGPAARSVVANVNELAGGPAGRPPRAVITWSRMTHTIEPIEFHSAEPNDAGGFDYVLASKGFPERICRKEDPQDCYPSARAPKTVDGQDADIWAAPATVGVTREEAMDGNVGGTTTAVMHDYTCTDNRGDITCPQHNVVWRNGEEPAPGQRNVSEAPGLDNLLLRVVTNQSGQIVSVDGFWTQEYNIIAGPDSFQVPEGHDNSWQGGYLQLVGDTE
jgi:hypothetical protein